MPREHGKARDRVRRVIGFMVTKTKASFPVDENHELELVCINRRDVRASSENAGSDGA